MATTRYAPTDHVLREGEGDGETLDVRDLAEGGVFAHVRAAGPGEAREAAAIAGSAEGPMRETTLVERAEWLDRIADELAARREELADTIVREAGKPITSARGEVEAAIERFRRAVEEVHDLQGEYLEGTTAGHEGWEAIVKPQPVGTVLCLTPYNYPLSTTALQVAPALAAGNPVILKPATQTPVSAALLAEAVDAVDLPRGAFNYVPGRASEIGDALAGDDRIDAVAMTGSSAAGNHVADESGMVTLHMELGGNAPALLFPDADLDDAVGQCARGSFKYAGQRCSAVSRVLAHESVHDEVVDRLDGEMDTWIAGDLFDEETTFGPLITDAQADQVEELVDDAVERGAELVRGGRRSSGPEDLRAHQNSPSSGDGDRDGQFFEPTLLADVPHDARLIEEEQFGPVAVVTTFADEREGLDIANAGDLGLDAAVFTSDHDRAMRLADRIEAGAVRINGTPSHGLGDIPFGGVKDSGIGREGIGYTIDAFTTTKTIVL